MTLISKYFGDIREALKTGAKILTTITTNRGGEVEAQLVIHDPARFDNQFVSQTDAALEYFDDLDARVRGMLTATVRDEESPQGKIYLNQRDMDPAGKLSPESFASALRVQSVVISPDGGDASPDRVTVTYLVDAFGMRQEFLAVIREGEGLVFREPEPKSERETTAFLS